MKFVEMLEQLRSEGTVVDACLVGGSWNTHYDLVVRAVHEGFVELEHIIGGTLVRVRIDDIRMIKIKRKNAKREKNKP